MKTILIRAEDKNRWERRAPVVPADLAEILKATGATAFVERSEKRVFGEELYSAAGAVIVTGMAEGEIILGIKEIPVEKILPHKTYLFFSHTIKGQKANMPLLQKIIRSGSTLIDYEKITTADGRRLIYFGPFAGHAGTIDILALLGEHWAGRGIQTPFTDLGRAHQYDSLLSARQHLTEIGLRIRRDGWPEQLAPFTVGILGYGNVSQGAQEILDCLPTERIAPDAIRDFVAQGRADRSRVYITVFTERDLVQPLAPGAPFDLQEYYTHPQRYESRFEPSLPSFTLLINAVYWDQRYPRFVTWAGLKRLAQTSATPKLSAIADITCDTHGSIECNVQSTDSDRPAYRVDPVAGTIHEGHLGAGIVLLAVDNLPCELAFDASTFFSKHLKPFIPGLLKADYSKPLDDSGLPPEIKKAVVVYQGRLAREYQYLNNHLNH